MCCISFCNAKKHIEIQHVVYLLLLTAMVLASGKYVTVIHPFIG